jgi:hypothetical protein
MLRLREPDKYPSSRILDQVVHRIGQAEGQKQENTLISSPVPVSTVSRDYHGVARPIICPNLSVRAQRQSRRRLRSLKSQQQLLLRVGFDRPLLADSVTPFISSSSQHAARGGSVRCPISSCSHPALISECFSSSRLICVCHSAERAHWRNEMSEKSATTYTVLHMRIRRRAGTRTARVQGRRFINRETHRGTVLFDHCRSNEVPDWVETRQLPYSIPSARVGQ